MKGGLPPGLFLRFFRWFCHPYLAGSIEGDLVELYNERLENGKKWKADLKFIIDVLLLFRPGIIRPAEGHERLNSYGMYKSYLKIGWRNLLRNKGLFAINASGLALGIATCLMIMMYVQDELSYDRYNEKADQIVRVVLRGKVNGETIKEAVTPAPVGPTLKREFPEVLDATRLRKTGVPTIVYKENTYRHNQVAFVDPNFFDVFTLPFIKGDARTALKGPNSIVLTQREAKKFFGGANPINKLLVFKETNQAYKVTGVIKKVPDNSHFHFDLFASLEGVPHARENNWLESNYFTYLLMAKGASPEAFEKKLPAIINKYMGPQVAQLGMTYEKFREDGNEIGLFVQRLTDIHLFSDFSASSELEAGGDINTVYIFGAVAVFMLVIACINFMNLSTAGATRRSKEIGVKKVLGSRKNQLVQQFLVESFISTIVAMALGILLVVAVLPIFNQLSGKGFEIGFLLSPKTIGLLIVLALSIGLLAGSYPAFFLSSIKPIAAMKNKLPGTGKSHGIRSTLVVVQFVISSTLILAIIIVSQQMYYIQNKNIGYSRDHRIVLRESYLLGNNESVFKEQLLSDPRIENVTVSAFVPAGPTDNNMTSVWTDKNPEGFRRTIVYRIDENYIPTMGMELMAGRNFYKNTGGGQDKVIVNEALVRALAIEGDPIGQTITRRTDNDGGTGTLTIVGVIRDFHFRSLHEPIAPLMMVNDPYGGLIIKANTTDMAGLIQSINAKWQSFDIGEPFTYALLDELYNETYLSEQKMGGILRVFGLVTIFVACLGLFGLVTFTAEQRVKEIGIRKVLGASVAQIVSMLSKDLLRPVALSFVIAFPVGFYFMDKWLQGFAYRIEVQWWVFLVAGVGTLWVAFFTLSFKTVRAALANPVQSLRTE